MAIIYSTNFDSDTANQLPTGWVNAYGGDWKVTTTNPVSAPNAFDGANSVTLNTGITSITDGEMLWECKYDTKYHSPYIRGNTTSGGYLLLFSGTPVDSITFFQRASSDWGVISSGHSFSVAGSPTTGDTISFGVKIVGTAIELTGWKKGTTRPTSGTGFLSLTSSLHNSAGYFGFYSQGYNNPPVDNLSINDLGGGGGSPATTYTLTGPSTATVGSPSSNFTITITGDTSVSSVFTPSDGSGGGSFSPTTVTIPAGTNGTGTFTYTPASTGSKTISTTNNNSLTNPSSITLTASAGGSTQTIAVDNAAITWSPGAWDTINVGTYGVSVLSKQSSSTGSYFKFKVNACTDVSLLIDSSISNSISAGNRPSLTYAVNYGARTTTQISAQSSIALVSGAASADRVFEIWLMSVENSGGTRFSSSAGTSFTNGVRIQGLQINSGASMAAYPIIKSKKLIYWGDSIVEGVFAGVGFGNNNQSTSNNDPLSTSIPALAYALDCEYGQVGYGGQGWEVAGSADVTFANGWNKFATDRTKSLSGVFDYAFVMHGTNDGSNVTSTVQAWIASARTALGANTYIFVVIPVGGFNASYLTAAYNAYVAANPADTKVFLLNPSAKISINYFNGSASNIYAVDGVHPNVLGNARIAGVIANLVNAQIGGGGGTTPNATWDEIIDGSLTARQVMSLLLSFATGKTTISDLGGGSATVTFKAVDGTTTRISASMTGSERTTVTTNP